MAGTRFARLVYATLALTVAVLAVARYPARAARPLLDHHQWDAYFALFAQDVSLPWKPTRIRLDTYSGAPVDFAAYAINPAEVIVAGANRPARAIDTSKLRPAVRWRFSPPAGYRFESSDVEVPLGQSEGFYVIEARRGDAAQQVWIDRTRIGLVTKESPDGFVVWGVDLRTGRGASGLKVEFLSGGRLIERTADQGGLIEWRDGRRPTFALAEAGASRAFVSMLPQAPLPQALLGVRVASSVVRAGEPLRVFGFVRRRTSGTLARSSGDVRVAVTNGGSQLAEATPHLDESGAFAADLPIPTNAPAGDYSVLATSGSAAGGTAVHVDAAADVSLLLRANCPCDASLPVPVTLVAMRNGAPAVHLTATVSVVRTPHIVPPGERDDVPRWGTTDVLAQTVETREDGKAVVMIPSPSDGLSSTYGVRAVTAGDGGTATAQVLVPTSSIALSIEPDVAAVDVGQAAGFSIRGFDATDGSPEAGLPVTVRLSHGATVSEQPFRLDENGRAHAVFHQPSLGSNLAIAEAAGPGGRHALDAASVSVAPRGLSGATATTDDALGVALDRARYRPGDRVAVTVSAAGAAGNALVTLEGARTYVTRLVSLSSGHGSTSFALPGVEGDVRVGAAAVVGGSVWLGSAPLAIDAPGHPRVTSLALDRQTYAPGDTATVTVRDDTHDTRGSTLLVRVTDGRPSGGAVLDDMPDLLAVGGTTSQSPSAEGAAWHAWVAPARSRVSDIFAAERPRGVKSESPSIGSADPQTLVWRLERANGSTFTLPVPHERGTFVLSVVRSFDDGDVGAATTSFAVS